MLETTMIETVEKIDRKDHSTCNVHKTVKFVQKKVEKQFNTRLVPGLVDIEQAKSSFELGIFPKK